MASRFEPSGAGTGAAGLVGVRSAAAVAVEELPGTVGALAVRDGKLIGGAATVLRPPQHGQSAHPDSAAPATTTPTSPTAGLMPMDFLRLEPFPGGARADRSGGAGL
jgi:hypothetical protein